jgi:hypothetical protein
VAVDVGASSDPEQAVSNNNGMTWHAIIRLLMANSPNVDEARKRHFLIETGTGTGT